MQEIGRKPSAEELAEKLAMPLEKNWARSSSPSGPSASSAGTTLTVKGRPLAVPRAARGIAWFAFADLCAKPARRRRLPRDRRSLCWVIVEGIPRLSSQQRNEARRFNILIDALYEARTLLIASAEVPPEQLYPEQLYTAGDGTFEFRRTVSRLIEMQGEERHH